MLTSGYNHETHLPQTDLVYAAFRLALQQTLCNLEIEEHEDCDADESLGFLSEVAALQQVALPVQVDLLAETWTRHRSPELNDASLLDAAVVHAAFRTAGGIINVMPDLALDWLADGPREISPSLFRRADHRLDEVFEDWWDDDDFLMVEDLLDLPPDQATDFKALLGLPDEVLRPMFDVLGRWRVSEHLQQHLRGLLTVVEIEEALPLLALGKARMA